MQASSIIYEKYVMESTLISGIHFTIEHALMYGPDYDLLP
jgi:hypothetical protein